MKIKNTNKLIVVDLASEKIEIKEMPQELIQNYLGGRGINAYLLYQYTDPSTQPLSSQNPLIVGTGLLTGIKGLNFSRTTITAKSPESGILGDANIGGGFGVNLKKNGFGYVVLKNKAKSPKIVVIKKDKVSLEDADHLWGTDTQKAQELIHDKYPQAESLCIGPAGENQVVFSCIINRRKNAAARCGMGAVMGSKNLKAIVALENDEELELEDPKEFSNCLRKVNKQLQAEFLIDRLKEYGSSHLFEIINESIEMGRVRNGLTLAFPENQNISPKNLKKFYIKPAGCKNCTLRCQHIYEYKGIKNEGPEYGVLAHFGPVLGIVRIEDVLVLNDLVNRLGLDVSSTANIIAWLIELYKKNLLPKEIIGEIKLDWSSPEIVAGLIKLIAKREGIGDFIASGPRKMLGKLPSEAEAYLCWTKKLVQSEPVDLRSIPAYALSNSVASRGSDHLRSRPIWVAFEFPAESLKEVYGEDLDIGALSYQDKGKVVFWWEHYLAMFDLLGLCKFLGFHTLPPGIEFSSFAEMIKTAYGTSFSSEQLKTIGERLINLERLYLQREGITRKDDYPPSRTFLPLEEKEHVREEDKELKLDKDKYDTMLEGYYLKRGWTSQGQVKPETIQRLNLNQSIKI
jgi:aldehyde:ferredoxin oxidoreductase